MKKIYIIKAGTTFPATLQKYGDFDDWTVAALGQTRLPLEILDVNGFETLPDWQDCAGVTVTGSHAMVTDRLPWSVRLEQWIADLVTHEVPFFGVCYGHQLLGKATGGEVGYHPRGKEIGTAGIRRLPACDQDPLFSFLPAEFYAHTTHAQSVLSLPAGAVTLAENDFEGHHAFRVGECAWGVQFHPEYSRAIMTSYIEEQAAELQAGDRSVPALLAAVTETPQAAELYRRFRRFVEQRLQTRLSA